MAERLWTHLPKAGQPCSVASVEEASSSRSHQAPGREPSPGPPHSCALRTGAFLPLICRDVFLGWRCCCLSDYHLWPALYHFRRRRPCVSHFVTNSSSGIYSSPSYKRKKSWESYGDFKISDFRSLKLQSHWCVLNIFKLPHQQYCCISQFSCLGSHLILNMSLLRKKASVLYDENKGLGTSLAVQWLRLHLPMQGVRVLSLVGELRSHMPHSQNTKKT